MWTSSNRALIPTNQSGTLFQTFDSIGEQVSLIFQSFSFNEVAVYTCESSLSDINDVPITESVLVTTCEFCYRVNSVNLSFRELNSAL